MGEKNTAKIKESLRESHLFAKLTDAQLDRVYRHSEFIRLDTGQVLFQQGETVNYFFMVLTGKIKLFRISPDGQEKIIEFAAAGNVFAEALMFIDQPTYPVSTAALEPTEVLAIDSRDFKAMLWDSVETCFLLMGDMSIRLRRLIHEIDTLSMHTGACRVAAYLLDSLPAESNSVELDVPKNMIAARLSIKPETFSRIIKNLRNRGIISVDDTHITIHDLKTLQELSIV